VIESFAQAVLNRLQSDFHRTTGQDLDLRLGPPAVLDGPEMCEVYIDGQLQDRLGVPDIDDGSEETVARFADWLCEYSLHEVVWGGWPMCPRHPTRPMWAETDPDGRARWICEADPADRWVIGQLGG
jgi:hypothetical protein